MKELEPHQQELLRYCPDLDPCDIPDDWWGAADLHDKINAKRAERLAAEAEPGSAKTATARAAKPKAASRFVTLNLRNKDIEAIAEYVAKLERRIENLEARPAFDYTGTFEQGRSYRKGQGCTQDGSIFVAMRDLPGTPGTPNSGWQLACKRGRDAR